MDPKPEKIIVGIAQFAVAHNPAVLITFGLGSCVAICLIDKQAKFGCLSHIFLPSINESRDKSNPLKFADSSIEIAVAAMLKKGCSKNNIQAKIAGGANMFGFSENSMRIGEKNVYAVKQKLNEMQIPVLASDTGENYGRTVEFYISSGIMVVKSAFKSIKEI